MLGLKDKPDSEFILQDRDILVVRQTGYVENIRVSISGEVNYPQSVVTEFKFFIKRTNRICGGLTPCANLDASSLIRDGKLITLNFNNLNAKGVFENGDIINIASTKELSVLRSC